MEANLMYIKLDFHNIKNFSFSMIVFELEYSVLLQTLLSYDQFFVLLYYYEVDGHRNLSIRQNPFFHIVISFR